MQYISERNKYFSKNVKIPIDNILYSDIIISIKGRKCHPLQERKPNKMKEIKTMVESIISQKERQYLMYKKEGINTIVEWMDKELASWRNILKAVEESELECELRNKIIEQEYEIESNLDWKLLNVVENRYVLEPYVFMRTYLMYVR